MFVVHFTVASFLCLQCLRTSCICQIKCVNNLLQICASLQRKFDCFDPYTGYVIYIFSYNGCQNNNEALSSTAVIFYLTTAPSHLFTYKIAIMNCKYVVGTKANWSTLWNSFSEKHLIKDWCSNDTVLYPFNVKNNNRFLPKYVTDVV